MTIKDFNPNSSRIVALRKEWERLSPDMSPFLYFDYQRNIFRELRFKNLLQLKRNMLRCVVDTDGSIIAILPIERRITDGRYTLTCAIKGCGITDAIFAPSLDDTTKLKAVQTLIDSLGHNYRLSRLHQDSPLLLDQRVKDKAYKTWSCYKISFGDDYDTWFRSLSSSVRQNVRTAYNRLARESKTARLIVPSQLPADEAKRLKRACLDLYINRQIDCYTTGKGRIGKLMKRLKFRFMSHDTRSLRNNANAEFYILEIDGAIAAFMAGYTSRSGNMVVIPRLAIDPAYRFYSPGYILIAETIRHLMQHSSIRTLDLSRGDEKYKRDLGGTEYLTYYSRS